MAYANHAIEFQNVWKSFWLPDGREQTVLADVSFFVPLQETVAILGRSGVGKSVALKHIVGFLKPDRGRVLIDGVDISGYDEDQLIQVRQRIGMVFQSGALFDSLSVAENVAFPLRDKAFQRDRHPDEEAIAQRVLELLRTVDLEVYADAMPADLSTGMKRAVAIARVLAAEPDCILYDEPTTMVDPLMAHTITELLLRLKEKLHRTSVVVTHDVALAERVADRLVMLSEGRVCFFGTLPEWQASAEAEVETFRQLDAKPPASLL
jgi:phospholipid/cholesterol/gamma-HCH transport system ATP-binding protein